MTNATLSTIAATILFIHSHHVVQLFSPAAVRLNPSSLRVLGETAVRPRIRRPSLPGSSPHTHTHTHTDSSHDFDSELQCDSFFAVAESMAGTHRHARMDFALPGEKRGRAVLAPNIWPHTRTSTARQKRKTRTPQHTQHTRVHTLVFSESTRPVFLEIHPCWTRQVLTDAVVPDARVDVHSLPFRHCECSHVGWVDVVAVRGFSEAECMHNTQDHWMLGGQGSVSQNGVYPNSQIPDGGD